VKFLLQIFENFSVSSKLTIGAFFLLILIADPLEKGKKHILDKKINIFLYVI